MPATAFLRLHTVFSVEFVFIVIMLSAKLLLNRSKTQHFLEKNLPRYLELHSGSDTPFCHTSTPCSTSLMFMATQWYDH